MIKLCKIFFSISVVLASASLFVAGCAGPAEKGKITQKPSPEKQITPVEMLKPAEFVLKFKQGDATTYKVIMERGKSVEFGGELTKDQNFKSGHTGSKVEMSFTQQIESVESSGNAKAKITIKDLKYLAKVKNQVVVDFDSSREKDRGNTLNKLIGKSYQIVLAPKGEIVKVEGAEQIQSLFKGNAPSEQAAAQLVSQDIVKKRHRIPALIDADGKQYQPGDKWKGQKNFSFGLMGTDSYEKIYALKEIKDEDGKKIAFVEIDAIPDTKDEQTPGLSQMFDQAGSYNGKMKFDLNSGKVEEYFEKMQSEWAIADIKSDQKIDQELSTIKMGTTELYSLEKAIDNQ